MALLDVKAASQYGLSAAWADKLFSQQISLGPISVDYTNSCASKDTWGNCQSATQTRTQPATFNSSSTLTGSNLTITGGAWQSNLASPSQQYYAIASNANAANPMVAKGVVLQSGNRANATTNSGVSTYFDYSNFTPQNISFIDSGNSAFISQGTVTATSSQLANGVNASLTFTFLPGATPSFNLSYTAQNTVTSTTTNGSVNSSSKSQEATVGISNTTKVSASAGIEGIASGSVENETTISSGWSDAWSSINEVNFSQTRGTEATDITTVSVNVDLSNLQQKPDGSYDYTTPVPTVDGATQDGVPQTTANFVPGKRYRAAITLNQSNVQNIVNGSYNIGGSVGSIKDTANNVISMTAAQALTKANQSQGPAVLDYTPGSLGSMNTAQTQVAFNGSSVFSTSLQYNFAVNYYEVVTPGNARLSDQDLISRGLVSAEASDNVYDLALVNNLSSVTGTGSWLALKTPAGERSVIYGSGNSNIVEASPTGRHHFINHGTSYLTGNDYQDKFTLDRKSGYNHIYSKSGDDRVSTLASQTADLGAGDDIYIIKGGKEHQITTGAGKDTVRVDNQNTLFHITDFDFLQDRLIAGGDLRGSQIRYEINYNDELDGVQIDGASLSFFANDALIGTAALDHNADFYAALNSPQSYMELALLNPDDFSYDPLVEHIQGAPFPQDTSLILNQTIFDSVGNVVEDWSAWDNSKRSEILEKSMSKLGSSRTQRFWFNTLERSSPAVVDTFSLDMISSHIFPASGISYSDIQAL
jgi:hypothetical protein